jgi:hypothetical protein
MADRRRNDVSVSAPTPLAPLLKAVMDPGTLRLKQHTGEPVWEKGVNMSLAIQAAIWLGAGVSLVALLSRRRRRRAIH